MCGIAGIIYKGQTGDVGREMTHMLHAMRHRGPDSTGYALYGETSDLLVMRFTLADPTDHRDFDFSERLERNRREVESRLAKLGATIDRASPTTPTARRSATRAS
jgi:asparagine synthetase B (glutamine-hydrolysing)